jgi:WD40 repeat protein
MVGPPPFLSEGGVKGAAFHPDGRTILTSAVDGVARLWDVTTGKLLGPPLGRNASGPVAFRPDGRSLVVGGLDGSIAVWPAPEALTGPAEQLRREVEVLAGMELDGQGVIRTLPSKR